MRERGGMRRVAARAATRATGVAMLLLALLAAVACDRPAGPAPVAWDRTRCDHCGMLVSDPAWAAQRVDPERGVAFYDDPGCLLVSLEADELGGSQDNGPRSTLWFHHHRDDVWLAGEDLSLIHI